MLKLVEPLDESFPNSVKKEIELNDNSVDEKCVCESGQAVIFKEGHKETEADKHHYIDILEGWVSLTGQCIMSEICLEPNKEGEKDNESNFNYDE